MMKKAPLQAILFDLSETLLDRAKSLDQYMRQHYKRYEKQWGHVGVEDFCRRFTELDCRGYAPKLEVYRELLEEFNVKGLTPEDMSKDYRTEFQKHAQAFPMMKETLLELRKRGYLIGIITNGVAEFQKRNMEALGLTELVDVTVISETEGLKKPARAIFLRASERLGVAPEQCLYIGDHPRNDVGGARAAGMMTGWFSGSGMEWPDEMAERADYEVGRLEEVLTLECLGSV